MDNHSDKYLKDRLSTYNLEYSEPFKAQSIRYQPRKWDRHHSVWVPEKLDLPLPSKHINEVTSYVSCSFRHDHDENKHWIRKGTPHISITLMPSRIVLIYFFLFYTMIILEGETLYGMIQQMKVRYKCSKLYYGWISVPTARVRNLFVSETHNAFYIWPQGRAQYRHFTDFVQCPWNNGSKWRLAMRLWCIFCYLSYPTSISRRCSCLLKQTPEMSIVNFT